MQWREEFGLWWPDGEADKQFPYMLNRVTDVDVALQYVQTKGVCIQAGGFNGMWAARLAKFFERIHSFEPIPNLFECLVRNTAHLPGVRCYNAALGPAAGTARIEFRHGGCSRAIADGAEFPQVTIDWLSLTRCDAIFLDIEGYEAEALSGAEITVAKFHPVIVVEKWPNATAVTEWLGRRNYRLRAEVHADQIWTASK